MLHQEELKIVGLFRTNAFKEITLREIMQKLGKKSYNWTYLAVQKLAKKGILITRKVGKTIVCRFNFDSPEAVTHLIYAERMVTQKVPSEIIESVKKVTPFFVLIAQKNKFVIILESEESKKKLDLKQVTIFTREEFKSLLNTPGENIAKELARDHTIPYGAEIYYSILLEVYLHAFRG